MFSFVFGSIGFGFSVVYASVSILTLSTFRMSGILSWNVVTTEFAMVVAVCGFGSFTSTLTTCEFCSLVTFMFFASSPGLYGKFSSSMTSWSIARLVIITLYVLMSSTFVRMVLESIWKSWSWLLFPWLTMNCELD